MTASKPPEELREAVRKRLAALAPGGLGMAPWEVADLILGDVEARYPGCWETLELLAKGEKVAVPLVAIASLPTMCLEVFRDIIVAETRRK